MSLRIRTASLIPFLFNVLLFVQTVTLSLPWGDINVIVVTDVHSWVSGQRHLFSQAADYGNVLSFYEQLPHEEQDIFFVMNGDFMDGTGLSTIPPTHLLPILEHMPWDVVNMGNHELYHSETVEYMKTSGFIDHWKGNYLTSNVVWSSSGKPIGNRYTILHAAHNRAKILTFGFLYNFQGNCNTTQVILVQDAVKEDWFRSVLRHEDYDAILVLAHMDYEDELVSVVHQAIRNIVGPSMPIQFINGHSHRRGSAQLDNSSAAMEAGHFLDTVGFVSFPVKQTVLSSDATLSLFQNTFIDAAVPDLAQALEQTSLPSTDAGEALSSLIRQTRDSLRLEQPVGCAPQTFRLGLSLDDPNSLWGLYMDHVVPTELLRRNESLVYIQGTGLLRYDLYTGPITIDDIIAVTPFNDSIYSVVENVDGEILRTVLQALENSSSAVGTALPPFVSTLSSYDVVATNRYKLLSSDYDAPRICQLISLIVPEIKSSCRPSLYLNTPTDALMIDLWIAYIQSQWSCEWHQDVEAPSAVFFLAMLVLFAAFAFLFYHFFAPGTVRTKGSTSRETLDDERTPLIRNRYAGSSCDHDQRSDDTTGHKKAASLMLPQHVLVSVFEKDSTVI
jgi:2',3'-cyclic-nucleotide 2'-phosphodiesterase (5'-nucleotidase family)